MHVAIPCPVCSTPVSGGIKSIPSHVLHEHGWRVSNPPETGFTCRIGQCERWYRTYNTLQKHYQCHFPERPISSETSDNGDGRCPVSVEVPDSTAYHSETNAASGKVGRDSDIQNPHEMEVDLLVIGEGDGSENNQGVSQSPFRGLLAGEDRSEGAAGEDHCGEHTYQRGHVIRAEEEELTGQIVHGGDTGARGDDVPHEDDRGPEGDGGWGGGDDEYANDHGTYYYHQHYNDEGEDNDNEHPLFGNPDEPDPPDGGGDETSSEEEEDNAVQINEEDIAQLAAKTIAHMRNSPCMTRNAVKRALTDFGLLWRSNVALMKRKLKLLLTERGLPENTAERFSRQYENSPFTGMVSGKGQMSALKKHLHYIEPVPVFLGYRADQIVGHDGLYRQQGVRESFQYVPLKEILGRLISKRKIREYMENLRPREDGVLECYTDGEQFKNNAFLQRYPSAFQLSLYYDDLEVVNPLGSKCQIHTIGAFYLKVLNIPPYTNSKLNGIHTVLLANTADIKDRGFEFFLTRFNEELIDLESEDGVPVTVDGEDYILRASLVTVTGDAKALHELLGLLGCGANHFCSLCMISREDFHNGVMFGEPRTRELHEEHLRRVARRRVEETRTGVRSDCCLHKSPSWHLTKNKLFDVFHDLPEGVIPLVIRLVLYSFITSEYLTDYELNRRIKAFNYGFCDRSNKPTANIDLENLKDPETIHRMKQSGSQMLCLLRALPFLLDGLGIPESDPHLEMLSILRVIVDFSLAPRINKSVLPYFREVLKDFRDILRATHPNMSEINKIHHGSHYPDALEDMGPMEKLQTIRDEGKHRPIKRHVVACNNYKNVPKTAIEFSQIAQAAAWGTSSPDMEVKEERCGVCESTVANRPAAFVLQALGYRPTDVLVTAKSAEHRGHNYRVGEFIVIKSAPNTTTGVHSFGRIMGVILLDDTIWLEVQEWDTIYYSGALSAYSVRHLPNGPVHLLDPVDLPLHPPLSLWRDYSTNHRYLSLKHFVV